MLLTNGHMDRCCTETVCRPRALLHANPSLQGGRYVLPEQILCTCDNDIELASTVHKLKLCGC